MAAKLKEAKFLADSTDNGSMIGYVRHLNFFTFLGFIHLQGVTGVLWMLNQYVLNLTNHECYTDKNYQDYLHKNFNLVKIWGVTHWM